MAHTWDEADALVGLLEAELSEQGETIADLVRRRNRLELARDRGDSRPGLERATARLRAATAYRRTLLAELADAYAELERLEGAAA